MSLKIKQRFLSLVICLMVGLFFNLLIAKYPFPAVANLPDNSIIQSAESPVFFEQQGKYFYQINYFEKAVSLWQKAYQQYINSGDLLAQSRVLSNLALAYSQLGNQEKAKESMAVSWQILNGQGELNNSVERSRILAQVFNNQGILQLNWGATEEAITSWQQAIINYQTIGDQSGVIRTSINQASAFKNLGLYHRALKTLSQVETSLQTQPDSIIKTAGLRSYGDILRLVGKIEESQQFLQSSLSIATRLKSTTEMVKSLLSLGQTFHADDKSEKAFEHYQEGLKKCLSDVVCSDTNLPLEINLAQFNLLLATEYWQRSVDLIPEIEANFANKYRSGNSAKEINFAYNLIKLRQKAAIDRVTLNNLPSWQKIDQILADVLHNSAQKEDKRATSYALGLRGQVEEQLYHWQQAGQWTEKALIIAQTINAPEISYLWQWQLGRIREAQGEAEKAIAHYTQAVQLLQSLTQDLVAIDPDLQYSFRESVEPIYRGLVSLLLTSDREDQVSQANLVAARDVIESLQLAELNNFFREACLDAQPVKIDRLDRQAAVIYPIILRDRLEVILSLPQQPLRHYSTAIPQEKLEAIIEQLRQSIVIRSRRQFYTPSQQLYDYLIRPAIKDLVSNQIKTLVFVPDGSLRNIPLEALHDGKNYLIEQYSVALTPGLQLLTPRPLEQVELKTIAAGLTEERQGFTALDHVDLELKEIKEHSHSIVLLNQEFTSQSLQQKIRFSDYPIVHIATHGQFSSSLEDTFILAWDSQININQLDNILQTRNLSQNDAIELLVLSACETAIGDKWAALGLAGMAVRAGARSTLATLWSVNDRATAELMSQFYQELSEKHLPKAEAIRQAQLKLIHSRWYNHPFYWAPYVLLGNWL
jgi:CHAT domain-containing protein/RNAse (barnase) inhibitor barstar